MEDADVLAAAKKVEEALGDDGRILLRQSGTEPLIRVMVEAKTDEICTFFAAASTSASSITSFLLVTLTFTRSCG